MGVAFKPGLDEQLPAAHRCASACRPRKPAFSARQATP
jgi:hypothetical protein